MCSVTAALQIGLSVASGAAQLSSQAQAAKAQERAQRQASINEVKRWQHEVSAARLTQAHQETADAMESLKGDQEADEAIATITTSAAERGIEGTSTGLAIANYMQMSANYRTALDQPERMNRQGLSMALTGAGMGFQQNMVNINQPIAKPDYLGVLIGTARQSFDAYSQSQLVQGQQDLYASNATNRGLQLEAARQALGQEGIRTGISQQSRNLFGIQAASRLRAPALPRR